MAMIRTTEQIGKRLKDLRERAKISQEKMAELVGVTRGQLLKYEYGKNMMNSEKLQLAANALSVPVQEFFTTSEESLPLATSEKLLLTAYRTIPSRETQDALLKLALAAAQSSGTKIE